MIFSNKLEPNQWWPFVEAAAREHSLAERAVESWMNGVAMFRPSSWKEDYNPGLSSPRNRQWNSLTATRDESKPSLYDFVAHQDNAANLVAQAIAKTGKPKMHVNHWRTYTAALMNQDVCHLALHLTFLHWVRIMGIEIYCDRNNIHGGTYKPYQESLNAIEHYMEVFQEESSFHLDLRFGKDVSNNHIDLTESDLIVHVDLIMYERVNLYPVIIEKLQRECSSLLPFVAGESLEMDISSFSFHPE